MEDPDVRVVVVPEGQKRDRGDKILSKLCPDISRSQIQRYFKGGYIWRDDQVLNQTHKLSPGDQVTLEIPPPVALELLPVSMELDILHEDADIIVLNKKSGIVVHPGAGTGNDTLVHGLLHYCKGELSGIGGVERPGIVHRLDKETSGVIVVAKTDEGFQGMTRLFAERELEKYYLAKLSGRPDWEGIAVDQPIGRHSVHRTKMCIRPDGRNALSEFSCLDRQKDEFLAEVKIHTGRTHQIRVHAQFLGHPVLGDKLYGYKGGYSGRILLHAHRLVFRHPVNGDLMDISAPAPFA